MVELGSDDGAATSALKGVIGGFGDLRGTQNVRVVGVARTTDKPMRSSIGDDGAYLDVERLEDATGQ